MNCQFCYTGRMGLLGNLTTAQVVEQVGAEPERAHSAFVCVVLPFENDAVLHMHMHLHLLFVMCRWWRPGASWQLKVTRRR